MAGIARDLAAAGINRLAPDARFLLYAGGPISDGQDPLRDALADPARCQGCTLGYREIDPDMSGDELEKAGYRDVERIAIVGAVIHRLA